MNCDDVQDLLAAYVEGEIVDSGDRTAIAQHLTGCAPCRAEREAVTEMLAHVSTTITAAGDGIEVPDVHWQDVAPVGRLSHKRWWRVNHNQTRRSNNAMVEMPVQPPVRPGRSLLAAASLAATLFIVGAGLFLLAALNSPGRYASQPDDEQTPPPPTSAPTSTPLPTATPTATADPLIVSGGFTENAIDVSGLPEYEVSGWGGGGGGGGGGCPALDPPQSVTLVDAGEDMKELCLYDIPDTTQGTQFTVRLTNPGGTTYEETFTVDYQDGVGRLLSARLEEPSDDMAYGGWLGQVLTDSPRTPVGVLLYFVAAQEYGVWQVEAAMPGAEPFAGGTVMVQAHETIYSVTLVDDPLDPFLPPVQGTFRSGDRVLLAGRGMEPGRTTILALYAPDPARSTDTSTIMIAYYATQITITVDGSFRSEFVVGAETPSTRLQGVFDPVPGPFRTDPLGVFVSQE